MDIYYKYSDYLKNKFNEKVYKLPINLPITCPNRNGCISFGGCTYCGEDAAGFECLPSSLSVKEQILKNKEYIEKKYKAKKFIAYFQNYTNTFLPLEDFKKYISEVNLPYIVDVSISTRPDCINENYLDFLKDFKYKTGINITIELGLQTSNYHTLKKINRGHSLAEYIFSANMIKRYNFELCTHVILNLPWDTQLDTKETAKIISAVYSDHVKLHALYILKNTKMAEQYINKEFEMLPMEEYITRAILFLEYLSPNISIQRLIGRAPKEKSLFVNWNTSWWKIKENIEKKMGQLNTYQGKKFDYLNGSALKSFNHNEPIK